MFYTWISRRWTKITIPAIVAVFIVDVTVALWFGKQSFNALTWPAFLQMVMDEVTRWTGRIVWLIAFVTAAIATVFRGKAPETLSTERVVHALLGVVPKALKEPRRSAATFVILVVLCPMTIWMLLPSADALPPPGPVLSTVDFSSARRQIFVAAEGEVQVFEADYVQRPAAVIPLGNPIDPGRPQSLAVSKQGVNGELYIADARTNQLVVADLRTHKILARIDVGSGPRSVVVTPDNRTAYVGNEQPVPQGTISEVDLEQRKVRRTIRGVNCPEGLAVSPNGSRLYVVTQCGGSQDPVFVIETATGQILQAIRGFAVGLGVAITPDGRKLYVARGGFHARDEATRTVREMAAQVSVIDTGKHEASQHLAIRATALAITPDGKYLLAGGDSGITVVNTVNDQIVNIMPVGSPPSGIALTKDGSAYVWLPEQRTLYLTGLGDLLSKR